MKDRTRNVIVGLTVMLALIMLGTLVVLFAGLPGIFQGGQTIYIKMQSHSGIRQGDPVHIADLRVGRITDISFTDPAVPLKGITLTARIDEDVYISANSILVSYKNMMGQAYIALEPGELHGMEALPLPPADQRPPGPLMLEGMVIDTGPLDFVKPHLESITDTVGRVDELTHRLIDTADKLSQLITSLNNITHKIEAGEGTLGKFVGDPQLYDEMVAAVSQINQMAAQFTELAKRWATDGINLEMK